MKKQLHAALEELRRAGARGLPDEQEIAAAKQFIFWKGTMPDGSMWQLVKHGDASYTAICGSETKPPSVFDK